MTNEAMTSAAKTVIRHSSFVNSQWAFPQLVHEISPPNEAGVLDSTGVKITLDGKSYIYGYRQILSDLHVVSGVR